MARTQVYDADGTLLHSEDTDPEGNEATIRQQAADALTANRAFIADANVTSAEAIAQTKALSRQVNALIRLQLADFTSAD
jgi:hypothetical protein